MNGLGSGRQVETPAAAIQYGKCFSAACEFMQVIGKCIEAAIAPTQKRFPALWEATQNWPNFLFEPSTQVNNHL